MNQGGMYTRLAEVPVPRRWWWWALLIYLLRRNSRRTEKGMEKLGTDLGEVVVTRWREADEATAAMLRMTKTMVRLTWAVVALTVVVIAATVYLGVR